MTSTDTEIAADSGTYRAMFEEYLAEQNWITPAERPLVHHITALCRQLDHQGASASAALSSSYLQAVERLDKRRPDRPPGKAPEGAHPDQLDVLLMPGVWSE